MIRAVKVERGKRIASLPDCALILLLASPRGLNALLENIEATPDPASLDGVPDVLAEEAAFDEANEPDRFNESFEGRR